MNTSDGDNKRRPKFDPHDPMKPAEYYDGKRKYTIYNVAAPLFVDYVTPNGFLDRNTATHALFRYYLSAQRLWERWIEDPINYEGEPDVEPNFRALFIGIAQWYSVPPEEMAKCWDMVDMQCRALRLPLLPDEERYRFNRVPVIRLDS